MNAVASQLHSFYSPQISEAERRSAHSTLLEYLVSDGCLGEADRHVSACVVAMTQGNLPVGCPPPDPLLLHFVLHAVETRARTGFERLPLATRRSLLTHLVEFLVAGFAWNVRCATAPNANAAIGERSASESALPAHVLSKTARAIVELGKREWVADATSAFPGMVLGLIDQNGHTADSLPKIFSGMVILTTLVDDALDSSRADVRAVDRTVLFARIASIADGIVAALEVGLRISGPGLPVSVPAAASRTVGSLSRIAPGVAANAIAILQRRTMSSVCDAVGAEALGVLADLYGESKLPLQGLRAATLRHLTELLNAVAMREAANGESEVVDLYRRRLTSYSEAVLSRCILMGASTQELEACLNGLMGATMRWAEETPSAFPSALDGWISVLETLEDADQEPTPLLLTAYGALARVCAQRCMFFTNAAVLRPLEAGDDSDDECDGAGVGHDPQENPEMLAEIGRSPNSLAAIVLLAGGDTGSDGIADEGLAGEVGITSRKEYVGKCAETLAVVSRMIPTVAVQSAELSCRVLRSTSPLGQESAVEHVYDKATAGALAHSIAPQLAGQSAMMRSLAESVAKCLTMSPRLVHQNVGPGSEVWTPSLDVCLLRAASVLACTVDPSEWSEALMVLTVFLNTSRSVLADSVAPKSVVLASTLLLLSLGDAFQTSMFADEPPLPSTVVRKRGDTVAGLGVVGITRWALELGQDSGKRFPPAGKRSAEELWPQRMARLQRHCQVLFGEYMTACVRQLEIVSEEHLRLLSSGSLMAHCLFWCLYEEMSSCKRVVWSAVARELCRCTVAGLRTVCQLNVRGRWTTNVANDGLCRARFRCISMMVNCMGCALRVFRRDMASEAPTLAQEVISTALASALEEQSPELTRSLLVVLREQLGDGYSPDKEYLVSPAVELAVRSLGEDSDVGVAAVAVLTEAITRHWSMFWPGDVASLVDSGTAAQAAREPSDAVRAVYVAGFGGLLTAVRSSDATLSREGMSAFERVHAARKLFSRQGAFQSIGGAAATVGACIKAMWSFPFLHEEACSLMWSVAEANWEGFYGETGALTSGVRALQVCGDVQMFELMNGFGRPSDRPTFLKAMASMVNDMRYASSLNSGPSL